MSILVVSNNTFNSHNIASLLKREGYRVLTAQSGQDALRLSKANPIDLVLLDSATADRDGYAINRRLEHNCNVGIIRLPVAAAHTLELVDPRLVTALQENELLKRVRAALQERQHLKPIFKQPSLAETVSRSSARWVQELNRAFTGPARKPAAQVKPSEQPALAASGVMALPSPPSILAGLINLHPALTAWIYLGLLVIAEICTFIVKPQVGLALHGLVLLLLLTNAAFRWQERIHHLLLGLTFVPLIRILSLSLPVINLPRIYWYLVITIPLLVVAAMMVRMLKFTWSEVGLNLQQWPLQLLVAPTGLIFGYGFYLLLKPIPLITHLAWPEVLVPALIVLVSTGFSEELIFRGILQRAAIEVMGPSGLVYVAVLYTNLHIGHRSPLNPVCAFGLSLFLGWVVSKTRSLFGVTLCHGFTNIMLFLIMPFLMP
ncbi:MAG: CPBP family intramembrane metalloprotease [Anaerolineae bacterium]|nr:CPBP family intramembrane metalloprotease [Anaerolineae bacterium]